MTAGIGRLPVASPAHIASAGRFRPGSPDQPGRVRIAVWNSGPPLPAAELPRVFDRLYRGEYARGTPGSGLGLTIARQIAELHGGTIVVTSADKMGTEAAITLPEKPDPSIG